MRRAFTLIELLIVVAIIAILAAIAVPNLLEAQVRSKVSRVKADMRSLATAVESYRTDNNGYPEYGVIQFPATSIEDPAVTTGNDYFEFLSRIPGFCVTTPIAYLSSIPSDLFAENRFAGPKPQTWDFNYKGSRQNIRLFFNPVDKAPEPWIGPAGATLLKDWGEWRICSGGPDGTRIVDVKVNRIYDPTNGTVSKGDIVRSQRNPESRPK
ncbi:MAG: prepilin-type N-terminal cleavage/methylation domain-containing protein [Candidatus Sumerlaeaceae bacterium]